jgi:hypothetical protein
VFYPGGGIPMTGVVEEGAKVATSVVEGLKAQPLSLALIAMNVVFVLFVAWITYMINQRTVAQYDAKDRLIEGVMTQLGDNIDKMRAEVQDNNRKIENGLISISQITDALNRVTRVQEDQEKRIRDLERRF